jgi:DNA-directed RNA polymerase specialized sigma54-like protein
MADRSDAANGACRDRDEARETVKVFEAAKQAITAIIAGEDRSAPFSDDEIRIRLEQAEMVMTVEMVGKLREAASNPARRARRRLRDGT